VVIGAGQSPLLLMYSVFNLVLGATGGVWIFMTGYKGLATK